MITFIYSWTFWISSILISYEFAYFPTFLLFFIGGIGPSLTGVVLTYKLKTREEVKNFWNRSFSFKQIKLEWYGIIIFFSLIPILLAGMIDLVIGGKGISINGEIYSNFFNFFPYLMFLIIAVLAEEFGWRGYAQDALQKSYSRFLSSLILGSFWALWHLPLFFMENTYQYNLGVGTLEFWLFFISLIPTTVLYTWIYNNTRQSILSAILFHFSINFFGETFIFATGVDVIRFIIILTLSIIIIFPYGHSKLTIKK